MIYKKVHDEQKSLFFHKFKCQWVPRLGSFLPKRVRTLKIANGATAASVFHQKVKGQWVPRLGSFLPKRVRTLKIAGENLKNC
uniref:B8 n=1 Tax=Human betaherpesvirus 6 TaxID=10368 RepID=A0A5P9S6B2_9BETA|nr:hypothetical protein [Human betaherpesvirus 6]